MSNYPKLCLKPFGIGVMNVGVVVEQCLCLLPRHHKGWCMVRPHTVLCTANWPTGASGILLRVDPETLETMPATYQQYSLQFRSAIQL